MTLRRLVLLLAVLALAAPVVAQTVRADRVTLNAGPCVITSGSAAPNGSRVGNVCDTFIQTTSGAIWTKTSGTGTSSGWIATLAGTGTPGTLAVWTSAGAIGDSIVSQAAGLLTVAGSATITGTGTMAAAAVTGTATIGTEHVTGNSTIGGTAGITGAATLGSTLDVAGVTTLRSDTSISGNTTLGGWIGTAGYASQVSGWRITNAGAADVRYLFTDELRAKLFTADAESVLAGSMRVTKSYSTVAQPFTCPAAGATSTLWVFDASTYGDAPVFQANDFVLIHLLTRTAFGPFTIADCVGTVSAYVDGSGANAGQQSWTFTRSAGANGGAMTGGTVVPVNQLVQDMGVSGNGYVEISAVDGAAGINAPYIQTNTWTTSPVAGNIQTTCRMGNLAGIWAQGVEYGLTCQHGGGFIRASSIGFELRNIPMTMFDGGTAVFYLNPLVPSMALGNPYPAGYAQGAGFWSGKDSDGTYKLRIGNPGGNRLTWDGNQLQIAGEGSGITNINGANIQAGTITAGQLTIVARPGGAAINLDPNMTDTTLWTNTNQGGQNALAVTIPDGVVGRTAFRSPPGASSSFWQASFPIDVTKTYRAHLWARSNTTTTGLFYFRLVPFDGNGAALNPTFLAEGVTPPGQWAEYHTVILPGQIASQARTATLALYLNWNATAGYQEVQDVRLEEAVPTTLITPGAVTTDSIAAKTITAANIAANAITVGELNVSGFGDNLIKNSTFEGPFAQALAGWSADPFSAGSVFASQTCCGIDGPGTLIIPNGAVGQNGGIMAYSAVPVSLSSAAQPYRVAMDVYSGAPSSGFFLRMMESTATSQPRYVRQSAANLGPNEVVMNTFTDLCSNCTITGGSAWTHLEFTYVPPSGTNWVSLALYNYSCMAGYGGTCQSFYFDGIEMQHQIGPGHIRANSITANQIAAGTITGDRIAARTIISGNIATGTLSANEIGAGAITGDRIAANTITGGNIAGRTISAGLLVANTITSNEIGVRAIVAGNIATGTLTANEIAAGTITADRMNVSALSAINANLGNITAGNISSVTITGSTVTAGCATMNSNGITLTAGGGACNWYKFSNGTIGLSSDGGAWMYLQAQNVQVQGTGSGGYLNFTSDSTLHGANQVLLDSNNNQIHLYNSGYIQLSVSSLSGTAAGAHLCLTTDNYLQRCQ